MNASNQAPVASFSIWITCVSTAVPLGVAKNSIVGGCPLKVPASAFSAIEIADCTEMLGVVEAKLSLPKIGQTYFNENYGAYLEIRTRNQM